MTFPDTRTLLPSAARTAITQWLLGRLSAAKLNTYGDPAYSYADVLGEVPAEIDGYAWICLYDCYDAARIEYDQLHPKHWVPGDPSQPTLISAPGGHWSRDT